MNSICCCLPLLKQKFACARITQPYYWFSNKSDRVTKSAEMIRERLLQMQREIKAKTPCNIRPRRSEYKCFAYHEIQPDPCIPEHCEPIDVTSYAPTDKLERSYQRTWGEFKPLPKQEPQQKPRIRKIYPDRKRRDPIAFRGKLCTACEPEDCELPPSPRAPPPRLFPNRTTPWPCCRMHSMTCRSTKPDGYCHPGRLPSCCVKRETPYLSFSECKKFPLPPPITACECEVKPSLCEVWEFYRKRR